MNRRKMRGLIMGCLAAAATALVLARPMDGTQTVYATSGNTT